jgi:hypothetical protein
MDVGSNCYKCNNFCAINVTCNNNSVDLYIKKTEYIQSPPIKEGGCLNEDMRNADPIIGGTWDTNLNNVVVDKFVGKIDDAKWYKSLAFDVRGYNKYFVNDA